MSWIEADRSIIPACDTDEGGLVRVLSATADLPFIGAYKIGAALALRMGLPRLVELMRSYTTKPLIYDHQKAATDIPDTADAFCSTLRDAGVDAVILFPLAGPATQTAWIQSAFANKLRVLVGGHMTHERFLVGDGGYVADNAATRIFAIAAHERVVDFVVPGNKPDVISRLRSQLVEHDVSPTFYAPGFIAQGGTLAEAAVAAGPRWHAIVGRGLYGVNDPRRAALALGSAIR